MRGGVVVVVVLFVYLCHCGSSSSSSSSGSIVVVVVYKVFCSADSVGPCQVSKVEVYAILA